MKNIFKKKLFLFFFTLCIFLVIAMILSAPAFARAGGSGGRSGSGNGDGEGLFWLIYIILRLIPFPYNIIVIALVVFIYYKSQKKVKQRSVLNQLPSGSLKENVSAENRIIRENPEFSKIQFIGKVKKAFFEIQQAWQTQNISPVRRFISDGIYQRFNTQFKMMKILKQKNELKNIEIEQIVIDEYQQDGKFEIITTAIMASLYDSFTSELDPSLNFSAQETFVELWTFIRKKGIKEQDIYNSYNCPNCGGPLENNLGEISKCPYCSSIVNSGEYDWILSEITQADDYIQEKNLRKRYQSYLENVSDIFINDTDFSVQLLEDKASNAYLQIMTSIACKDPAIMRRFVTNNAYDKIRELYSENRIAYNQLYLNRVTLIDCGIQGDFTTLYFSIRSSYQRILIKGGEQKNIKPKYIKIEPQPVSKTIILKMIRKQKYVHSKGFLYSHNCPNCGGTIKDTTDITCQYCGSILNSPDFEWIVDDLRDSAFYIRDSGENPAVANFISLDESVYKAREYALNNLFVIISADGKFEREEQEFALKIIKKLNFNPDKINHLFEMAKSGRLTIKMPQDKKTCEKIYRIMERAAMIGEGIDSSEKEILDYVKNSYL